MNLPENDRNKLIKRLKREPISLPGQSTVELDLGKAQIERLIPHRVPFLLINRIKRLSLEQQTLEVGVKVEKSDPVFAGHFPDNPVYPGVLLIEMMGQAGLCLSHYISNQTDQVASDTHPVKGLFTRVHNAGFIQAVLPEDDLIIRVQMLEMDPFFGMVAAQVLRDGAIVTHSLLEVYFDE